MLKFIFDLITSSLSLLENSIYNYIVMGLIGSIAFVVAYRKVGELGLRGEAGSIVHWIIRLFVFLFVWLLFFMTIKIVIFINDNLVVIIICLILLLSVWRLKKYADSHPESKLNKKI